MRRRNLILFCAALFSLSISGCNTFEGVAGDPGENYTTRYNIPGERIVPYNTPTIENKESYDEVKICEGVPSEEGFRCQ